MKFLCGSCQTKYQISDAKVVGKVLTIRCNKCGSKILVRESLAPIGRTGTVIAPVAVEARADAVAVSGGTSRTSDGAKAGGSAALASAFDLAMREGGESDDMPTCVAPVPTDGDRAGVEWYVAFDGQQAGPYAYADLVRRVESGEVTARHYAWYDGMGGWTRVRDVPDLAPHLGAPKRMPPPPPPATNPLAPAIVRDGADIVDLAARRRERGLEDANATARRDTESTPSGAPSSTSATARAPASAPETKPAPDEATEIDRALKGTAGIEASANAPAPSTSGLEDALAFDGGSDDIFANVPRATPADLVARENTRFFVAAAGMNARRSKHKLGLVIGVSVGLAIAVFMASWATGIIRISLPGIGNPFESGRGDNGDEYADDGSGRGDLGKLLGGPKDGAGRATAPSARRKKSNGAPGSGGMIVDADDATGSQGTRGGDDVAAASIDEQLRLARGELPRNVPIAQLPQSKAPDLPVVEQAKLSEDAIQRVVNARQQSVRICYEQAMRADKTLSGKLEMLVTIEPTGRVSRVAIETAQFKNSPVAKCIADKVRNWPFPPFAGKAAQDALVPFHLTKGT